VTIAILGLLLLYVASVAPASELVDRGWIPARPAAIFYRPLFKLTPDWAYDWLWRYTTSMDGVEGPRIPSIMFAADL
jgi:hypothetical protein